MLQTLTLFHNTDLIITYFPSTTQASFHLVKLIYSVVQMYISKHRQMYINTLFFSNFHCSTMFKQYPPDSMLNRCFNFSMSSVCVFSVYKYSFSVAQYMLVYLGVKSILNFSLVYRDQNTSPWTTRLSSNLIPQYAIAVLRSTFGLEHTPFPMASKYVPRVACYFDDLTSGNYKLSLEC